MIVLFFSDIQNIPSFYKQAFEYYNKAFVTDKTYFENTIMNQQLWGNKFITHYIGRRKNVLFLRNWIRSSIRKVGDLMFTNGILDERYVYGKVTCKQNIYCEIMVVKTALQAYQQSLKHMNNCSLDINKSPKSKDFYGVFKLQLTSYANITRISDYLVPYCTANDEICAFTKNVSQENEIKLKEFNFKVLHGILPCNRNLMRWQIRQYDSCDVCGETQTIKHLLYDCSYVKPLWHIVNVVYGTNVNFKQILGLDEMFDHNAVTTIICFVIYKEWLLLSLDNKKRSPVIALAYFKNELNIRIEIYERCKSINSEHIERLKDLVFCL